MKIGNTAENPATAAAGSAASANAADAAKSQATAAATPLTPDASATIALSSTASTLMEGGTHAEFDADKVARISKSIADGSFKVNHVVIADKLISNAQELLSKVQR